MSDFIHASVKIFGRGGAYVGDIPGITSPEGLAADAAGDVYIADGYSFQTLVYASDGKTLIATLPDPGQRPHSIAVHSVSGLVAVASDNTRGGPDSIEFYLKGKTTTCRHIVSPPWFFIEAVAFDVRGNLYVVGETANNGQLVGVIPVPGCAATTITTLSASNTIVSPAAVQITPGGNIVVLDAYVPALYTYAAPLNGSLGQPIATTPLNGLNDPRSFALSQEGAFAYVADPYYGDVSAYAYPAGGAPVKTIGAPFKAGADGVTVTPIPR